jgi:hypothetical protein
LLLKSLISTIKFLQPSILNNEVETYPISLNPPANFFDCMYKITNKKPKKEKYKNTKIQLKIM